MIEIRGVSKSFHNLVAISDLTLEIPRGEVLGILGPNGAGKTTLFKLITGFLSPDTGRVRSLLPHWPRIGYKSERLLFPNNMRVRQYLEMVASLSKESKSPYPEEVNQSLQRLGLGDASGKRIKDCSKGMRQRLALAQALIGNPSLVLLDEPSNGLDPEGQVDICHQIELLHEAGKTIVLASHQLEEVTRVCTQLVILNRGRMLYQNSMAEALAEKPHSTITVDKDLAPIKPLLESMHEEVEVKGMEVILNKEALQLRRPILSILLGAGFDVIQIEQRRVTLSEIYAETLK